MRLSDSLNRLREQFNMAASLKDGNATYRDTGKKTCKKNIRKLERGRCTIRLYREMIRCYGCS